MSKNNDRVMVLKSLVMVIHILVNGRMIKLMEMVNLYRLMEGITKESGIKIWLKDRDGNTLQILDAYTLESGITISNMATAKKNGLIMLVTKEITKTVQNADMANTYIQMVPFFRVIS